MASLPLTHHEILEWARPFAQEGRHVDLAASNRLERRVVFLPVERRPGPADCTLRETLALEQFDTGTFQLTRILCLGGSLTASLSVMGARPVDLLECISAVDPARQVTFGRSYRIARSYKLPPVAAGALQRRGPPDRGPPDRGPPDLLFTQGIADLGDVRLTVTLPTTVGVAADIVLEPQAGGACPELPDDLLAVLGWDWVRLVPTREGWKSKLRLRGDRLRRSRGAERALERAAQHLARTFAEPPGRFHERWARARWGVVVRRSIPALMLVLLGALIAVLPQLHFDRRQPWVLLLFDVPTALIALSLCLQELPRYEIPPLPRRLAANSWRPQNGA